MVSINRYNYEEYFLLYVDNELSAAERKQVETFVAENPDLEEELMMLKQSQLKPDVSLVLEDKSCLFKTEKQSLINLENYETFFLLYVDEELSAEERRAVELFAGQHPAQQQELEILMQTRITPETSVVFPDKASLYKKVGSEKVVAFRVWRIVAVAAMVILAVGILWMNSRTDTQPDFATNKDQGSKKHNDGQVVQNSNNSSNGVGNKDQVSEIKIQESGIAKGETNMTKDKKNLDAPKQDESGHVAVTIPPTNVSKDPEFPERSVTPRMIAKVDAVEAEVKSRENLTSNTLIIDQPYEQAKPKESIALTGSYTGPDEPLLAIGPVQTKNKLRGLFRRVTRVVEKNTHISTGENKRLLIGNLEIALK